MTARDKTLICKIATLILSCFGLTANAMDPLSVGSNAPVIDVTIDTGETLSLSKFYQWGPTLIYFYPKSFTPGCTKQACNLRDNYTELQKAGIQVVGVSFDPVEKQAEFRKDESLQFPLVSDPDGKMADAFGVGRIFGSAFKRQSFLVVDGKIAWVDTEAKPTKQSEDALAALAKIRTRTETN